MTHMDQVKQGAAANRRANARTAMELLISVRQATTDEHEQLRRWSEALRHNESHLDEVILYAFKNWSRSLDGSTPRPTRVPETPQQREERSTRIANLVDKMRASIFDQLMSNGKRLGDCTRKDLVRMTGQTQRLASMVGEGQTVQQCLTEKQVRRVLGQR